ncbi:uncharacterized protein BX664DRAFT_272761 [Halteromyces radiatus]|uniref:uncharacterized protein n=1 Tax=Halteromyces radiatus TaxID=101107 RepID=UPI00221E7E16|nr:uncharacterized protein BX664DRAFT_272761 [Halteromyces radiatus]KAI8099511.1 hypothetical protein BX664DRAFT_272761 [Halteromyces radiatus]
MSKHSSFSLHFLSQQNRQELQDMFNTFDKDHDEKVSSNELRNMLGSTGIDEPQIDAMLSKVRTDTQGNLSFEEFAKLMRPTLRTPLRLTKRQQELLETFKVFDRDGDGVINAKELTAMMHQLGDKITMEEAEQLISEVDENKDGVVNFEEFARMMGVRPPDSPTSPRSSRDSFGSVQIDPCTHKHHRFSFRRFFCKHPQ